MNVWPLLARIRGTHVVSAVPQRVSELVTQEVISGQGAESGVGERGSWPSFLFGVKNLNVGPDIRPNPSDLN